MFRLLNWLKNNFLFFLSLFLLVFIPLYPKLPLFEAIPGYIVRVRFEDLLVLFTGFVFVIHWLKNKIQPHKNPLFWLVIAYLIVGLISIISAIFLTKTIPNVPLHWGKSLLHWFRRIEYIFLLFLFASSIRTKFHIKLTQIILAFIIIIATVYGFGQKYFYWPVYSTMNREFSKGWRLVLTEHARVPSTFAGHYDLAAYLVLVLPIILVLMLKNKNKWLKTLFFFAFFGGYLSLILTASLSSYISFHVAVLIIFILLLTKKTFWRGFSKYFSFLIISIFLTFFFGDIAGRFQHYFKIPAIKRELAYKFKLPRLKFESDVRYINVNDELALVADKTDAPPIIDTGERPPGEYPPGEPPPGERPPDVYEDIPLPMPIVGEDGEIIFVDTGRTYSDAALSYGLSSAIRFDKLWPMAIDGWKKNLLLGSGYATLNKEKVTQFTDAESTDNDYLRALGETGLLGFLLFFGTISYVIVILFKNRRQSAYLIGLLAGIIGLLINASYIDVFEASKVAFTFWALIGLAFATIHFSSRNLKNK